MKRVQMFLAGAFIAVGSLYAQSSDAEWQMEVAKLKEENRHLTDERDELKYMLNDMHSVVDAANDDFFSEMSRLCGCIEIEGTRITSAYQDLVGILLANGYTVEVTPLHNNTRLQVVIKESEDEINE
mgnify:CR=1 FL=1